MRPEPTLVPWAAIGRTREFHITQAGLSLDHDKTPSGDLVPATRVGLSARGLDASDIVGMGMILFAGFANPDGNSRVLHRLGTTR